MRNLLIFTMACFGMIAVAHADDDVEKKCEVQVFKSPCWNDYNVTVSVHRAINLQELEKVTVKKGSNDNSMIFECPNGEPITFRAKFSPPIWLTYSSKRYASKRVWDVPMHIAKDVAKWKITVCYPGDFQSVPTPPGEADNCACEKPKKTTPK